MALAPSVDFLVTTNINSLEAQGVPAIHVINSSLQAYRYIVMQRSMSQEEELIPSNKRKTGKKFLEDTTSLLEQKLHNLLYIFIGLFLVMDICLWVFRLSWLYTQIQEAKQGCEEFIPQDENARKILKIQTAQNPPKHFDLFEHSCPYTQNINENVNPENELNVYFCQSYPRSKEDILRDIWAQKMLAKTKSSKDKLQEMAGVENILSFICWLHRVTMSKLLWRFLCSSAVVIFVCSAMCFLDMWLCHDNLSSMVGTDLLSAEVKWQVDMVNNHLSTVASTMTDVLASLKRSVDLDVEMTNSVLFVTWEKQMIILKTMLTNLCDSSVPMSCDLTILNPSQLAPISSCNFLPMQATFFTDINIQRLQTIVSSDLFPVMDIARKIAFMSCYIVIGLVCARIVCQVVARVVKDYLIISKHLPCVRIYQFSNLIGGMSDDPSDGEKEIHRSASWLESCESGVYVGDNDDSARESTI